MKIIKSILFLVSFTCVSQNTPDLSVYTDAYPEAHFVRLNQEILIEIELENGKINVTQEIIEEDIYLNDFATQGSKRSLNFSSFFEMKQLEAASFNYENGNYKEYKVNSFKEKDELDDSFYDDSKSINFIYPNLKKGSKSKLKYKQNIKNPRFLSSFYLNNFFPILNNKITIEVDKDIELIFKEFNLENLDIKFNKTAKRKKNIYTWEIQNTKDIEYEYNVPTYKSILAHIIPIIATYKTEGETVKLLNDVSGLYNWYYSLVKDINKEETNPELVELVNNLIKDKKSDLEKVKAIYYWAQDNIKYIAFEYALGGFIPREANDVFQKKYGDCKDNSSILYEMLKIANIEGKLTWIGTREIPYDYNEVPTPAVDNHMILTFKDKDTTYFLDATGRYIPFGMPTSFIQGKEALVENGELGYSIEKVPVVPAEKNVFNEITNLNISNDKINGSSKAEISGYLKIDYYHYLEDLNTEDKIKSFYNSNFEKGNNKFLIQNITETNKYNYDKNLIVDYNFSIENYSKALGDELYVNLNLNKKLSNYRIEKERKHPLEYDYKQVYHFTNILEIPEGYTVDYLPENAMYKNDIASFEISYTSENNLIEYKHSIILDFLELDLQKQKKLNTLINKAEKSYKEIVILKKK